MDDDIVTYLAIATNGTTHEYRHRLRPPQTLWNVLDAALGGEREEIRLANPRMRAWCDAEGVAKGLTVNLVGSRLIHRIGLLRPPANTDDSDATAAWVGTLFITGREHDSIRSLTDQQITEILVEVDHYL